MNSTLGWGGVASIHPSITNWQPHINFPLGENFPLDSQMGPFQLLKHAVVPQSFPSLSLVAANYSSRVVFCNCRISVPSNVCLRSYKFYPQKFLRELNLPYHLWTSSSTAVSYPSSLKKIYIYIFPSIEPLFFPDLHSPISKNPLNFLKLSFEPD